MKIAFTAAHTAPACTTTAGLGGLGALPGQTLWLVALGDPQTQGSNRAPAAGVVVPDNPRLHPWRRTVTRAASSVCTPDWLIVDGPVIVDACFTIEAPAAARKAHKAIAASDGGVPRLPPTAKHDVDKLLRAVFDALSPRTKSGQFRMLADDGRVTDGCSAKTYPSPAQTHSWALPQPGVVLRISALDSTIDAFPRSTLKMPPPMPPQVRDAYQLALAS